MALKDLREELESSTMLEWPDLDLNEDFLDEDRPFLIRPGPMWREWEELVQASDRKPPPDEPHARSYESRTAPNASTSRT